MSLRAEGAYPSRRPEPCEAIDGAVPDALGWAEALRRRTPKHDILEDHGLDPPDSLSRPGRGGHPPRPAAGARLPRQRHAARHAGPRLGAGRRPVRALPVSRRAGEPRRAAGAGAPLDALRACLAPYRLAPRPDLPIFPGAAIGYFAYDLGASLERVVPPARRAGLTDDIAFNLYDTLLAVDHARGTCLLIATGFPETDPEARRVRAEETARRLRRAPGRAHRGAAGMVPGHARVAHEPFAGSL